MTLATLLHAGAIPLLAGSLASAEERQLGTRDWQGLLPVAAWRQWAVKVAVVLLLSLGSDLHLWRHLSTLEHCPSGPDASAWGLSAGKCAQRGATT